MMRRISMAARDELVAVVADRYARGDRGERGRILDEFAAVTGYHRKHAMRLLRAGRVNRRRGPRPGRRIYDEAVREALIVVWEASDRICGKRLRPATPLSASISKHTPVVQDESANAGQFFPIIHTLFSNIKAWLVGTHHGVSAKHLPRYLRE